MGLPVHARQERNHRLCESSVLRKLPSNFLSKRPITAHNIVYDKAHLVVISIIVQEVCVTVCFAFIQISGFHDNTVPTTHRYKTRLVLSFEFRRIASSSPVLRCTAIFMLVIL